jgi:hypothetical protein
LRVRWALVGGLAVSVRAEPRTTLDIDLVLAMSGDDSAEALVRALRSRGYWDNPLGALLEQKELRRLEGVRLVAPVTDPTILDQGGIPVDLLFASSGVENEIATAAEQLEILPGVVVPVARSGHLLALKVLAGRPRDLEDCRTLLNHSSLEDFELARQALDLISRRDFDRGKDLLVELEKMRKTEE